MILAAGTLLAIASLRQSDIATRSRQIVEEYLHKLKDLPEGKAARRGGLKKQVKEFQNRYEWLKAASVCFALAIAAQILCMMSIIAGLHDGFSVGLYLSLLTFSGGVFCLIREFCVGSRTLKINNEILN